MQDPRLAELELLSDVDKKGNLLVENTDGLSEEQRYGLSTSQFRDLVVHLLLEGYVNGLSQPDDSVRHTDTVGRHLSNLLRTDLSRFLRRTPLTIRLNHKGRLRLWVLRDELLSSRRLEPYGLLYSREYWHRDWEIIWAFQEEGHPVSLVMLDLDDLKGVNDKLGHNIGDLVMKNYLQVVRDSVEKFGDAYCVGGDEVKVILPELLEEKAFQWAEHVCTGVAQLCQGMKELAKLKQKPTVSIGGATFKIKTGAEAASKIVDGLLYQAKELGRNRVCWKT